MQIQSYLHRSVLSLVATILISSTCIAAQPASPSPQVEIKTNLGNIVVELYPDAAPKTVKNFLQYVKDGFYNGTIFHRVIDNFMIQGGGMDKDLKEKKMNAPIPLEAQIAMEHGLKNSLGTISMARTEDPNSATSQFFINVADNDFLNAQAIPDGDPVQITRKGSPITIPRSQALLMTAGYTPFGRVIDGMNVVNKIKIGETQEVGQNSNLPKKTITIISVKILKKNIAPKSVEEQITPKTTSN